MAIAFFGSATTVSTAAETNVTVNLPANIPKDALVVVAIANNSGAVLDSMPTGWLSSQPGADGGCYMAATYWIADDTAPTTAGEFVFAASGDWAAIACVYTGTVNTTAQAGLFPVRNSASHGASSTTMVFGIAMVRGDPFDWLLGAAAVKVNTAGLAGTADNGPITERADVTSSGASPVQLAFYDTNGPAHNVSGTTVTWTCTSASASDGRGWHVRVRPPHDWQYGDNYKQAIARTSRW
jgi:hypothetical protein